MTDQYGRPVRYLRISLTDRCNLRCRYCMPEQGVDLCAHTDLLRYEEIVAIARAALDCGMDTFKLTGGEPLVRRGVPVLVAALKALPGTRQVTLTTNGLLLGDQLDALVNAGLDAVNVSLDTLDETQYHTLTRRAFAPGAVVDTVRAAARRLPVKINAVLLPETADQWLPLARLAADPGVDVRFIEQMPIGKGEADPGLAGDKVLGLLRQAWPDLAPCHEHRGNGPAHYYKSAELTGRIGFIDAVSHRFCASCNRLRLTCTGMLRPCLCYDDGTDLRALLRGGAGPDELKKAVEQAIAAKPEGHCFGAGHGSRQTMNRIGG